MFFSFKEYLNFARFLVSRELTLQTRKREGWFAFAGNRVRTGHEKPEKSWNLRWLDTVFQSQYLPSLSINYVAINKVLEKLPPQLY